MGNEENVEKGESIDLHVGGGGFVCEGEEDTWRTEKGEENHPEEGKNREKGVFLLKEHF